MHISVIQQSGERFPSRLIFPRIRIKALPLRSSLFSSRSVKLRACQMRTDDA